MPPAPCISRLKRRADFLRVASLRQKSAAGGLILQVAPTTASVPASVPGASPETATTRIGFTASRKVGNAVRRNRAKRRLRAAVAEVMTDHALPGHDYVLIARDTTAERPWTALLADLEHSMKRLKAWRP
jgi:ribonuclease P protein component